LLPKAARWLVTNRRNGYWWDSTKQTAFAIFGLTDYLKASQEMSPNYDVQVYLNNELVLNQRVTAAEAASATTFVVKRKGLEVGPINRLRVVKRGSGMLYFSATAEYYTGDQSSASGTDELQITREYFLLRTVDNNGKLEWSLDPLPAELKSGDVIVSRLTLKGKTAQRLLIEDPIPAGMEQVSNLSGLAFDYTMNQWTDWFSSREFRDERTVFDFDGETRFQYAMRVQIPGEYRVNPARAELMYRPEVHANSATVTLRVLDK
jgi:uncharacterized protein YfaS (alpha-2-macroglobulin family)